MRQTLEKTGSSDPEYVDKAKINVDHWIGLCLRAFDYSEVPLFQIEELELDMFFVDDEAEEEDHDRKMAELRSAPADKNGVRFLNFIYDQGHHRWIIRFIIFDKYNLVCCATENLSFWKLSTCS